MIRYSRVVSSSSFSEPTAMTTPPPAESGTVDLNVSDGIAVVRFGHPKGNSLPARLLHELAEAVGAAGADDTARVVVLRSEGTGPFCGGASFDELRSIGDETAGREFFMGFARLILAMRDCPKFVIARVHGRAVGGGVGVAAAADYTLAVTSASVKLSELAVGIGPFVVGPAIQRRIGAGAFTTLAVDATRWHDAAWAEQQGLYSRLLPTTDELDDSVNALAATLARSNPEAMATMKRVFWEGTEGWDELLADRAAMSGRLVLSEFTRAAIARVGR